MIVTVLVVTIIIDSRTLELSSPYRSAQITRVFLNSDLLCSFAFS